jgi:hypothetical protein
MKGLKMRVKFKDMGITLKNESEIKGDFICHFCGYLINVERDGSEWSYMVKDLNEKTIIFGTDSRNNNNLTNMVQMCLDEIEKNGQELEKTAGNCLKMLKAVKMYEEDEECPYCGGKKIFKFRLDSDWAYGAGDYYAVNDDQYYTEEEFKYDSFDRPDIAVYHCRECNEIFN